ncbi:type I polyketide synthase [Nocardia cyriacigeorgica]|uniref:type I polyketide synthase n=1 Tax=Nocardia cyriacigeorgica TaxID=135487 RepID=UPI00245650E3|nr:type I polyketide synthase [Nocardia cyriacigeorgica]
MNNADDQTIAIIGIGCRLPGGVTGPGELWELLEQGVDAITPTPEDRWDVDRFYSPKPQQPGRISARRGGYLDEVDTFDAAFFGISGRIAEQMDPQQRQLLEVAWETFEDAGVVPGACAGTRTGVFIGACSQDYGALQSAPSEVEGLGAHSATGTFMSIVSNRLSYTFDLRGPSMTIDTACSSSLVAVHLAVESLRRGESELAMAGGVNLMLTPQFGIALSQAAMLSPDGRSRAFDAAANGYVRGEGVGLVLLKPLDRARRDGDRVYAVIRGSAVNQDGRTQGITVPSGESQEANFRAALAVAGVDPADIGYVEAHGTGTPVGDPIEANALGRVLRTGRAQGRTALLGSIKTNIGHLEAAAGIAGLIKAALCVQHRRVPPSLHYREGNPDIDFGQLPIAVAATGQPWPDGHDIAYASVNSFGFGGTNANVVLAEAIQESTEPSRVPESTGVPTVLTFSARSAAALDELSTRHARVLETSGVALASYGAATALRRGHHEFRRTVIAVDAADAAAKLRAGTVVSGQVPRGRSGKVAFVFNGQGPQWYAMGRTLLETSPVYRDTILECDRTARQYIDWSIYEALTADEADSPVGQTRCLQPTMFAVQIALAALWRSRGIEPDAVVGHSMGEIAAAHVSGALSLSEALKVICHRARIQDGADPTGAMMFVAVPQAQADELAARYPGQVWVSALNSPRASTLSGRRPVLEALAADLDEQGIFARLLRVNCACHSQDMDPLRDELLAALGDIEHAATTIPLYSTLTGARIEGTELGTEYWWRNFRQPVLFESAIRAMLADGYDTFVELSPHPVLTNSVTEISAEATIVPSLMRKKDDWATFLDSFARLYTDGAAIDWSRHHQAGAPVLDVARNPWQRQSFWNESEISQRYRAGGQRHPMLKPVAGARPAWEISWDDHRLSWVREHDVFGSVIVPGAAYIEAALAAASEWTGQPCGLEFVEFERACVLGDEPQLSRLELDPEDGTFEFHQRSVRGDTWLRNARGRFHVSNTGAATEALVFDLAAIRERCTNPAKAIDVYGRFAHRGYAYGPAFCGIDRIDIGRGEALARIQVPRVLRRRLDGYLLHPAVLDACFQSAILHPTERHPDQLLPISYLPTGIERVRMHRPVDLPVWCYTRPRKNDDTLLVDIYLLDEQGTVLAEYTALSGKAVRAVSESAAGGLDGDFYTLEWQPCGPVVAPQRSALSTDLTALAAELAPTARQWSDRLDRTTYAAGYQRDIARLCAAYVSRTLDAFGLDAEFTVGEIPTLLPKYRRALQGLLRLLVEDGSLREEGEQYRRLAHSADDVDDLWARMFDAHPACAWELLLLRRTGDRLHEVLTGAADPIELLFAEGSLVDLEAIYQNSPIARFYNALGRELVRRLADSAAPGRTLRILEVGGGTGGLTASLLPVLPADRCEYVFTDVSPAFLATARERFRGHDIVDYRVLDLEHDPAGQGITAGSFDLVVASDVVHATADAKKTLLYLQELLAPEGVLMLLEAAPDNPWLDLTFGLTEGWWSFRDHRLRPQTPLLSAHGWEDLLRSLDFAEVVALGDPAHQGPGSQALIVARTGTEQVLPPPPAPEPEPGTWLLLTGGGDEPLADALAERLRERGGRAVVERDLSDLGEVVPTAILDLRGSAAGLLDEALTGTTLRIIDLLRQVCRDDAEQWPRVVEVTRGAHVFRSDRGDLTGAAAWGLAAVIGVELPQLRFTVVDLDAEPTPGDLDALWAEVHADGREREVVIRSGERFVRRLASWTPRPETVQAAALPPDSGVALTIEAPGSLDALRYHERARTAPAAGEVEIEVVASGLNFLDVMIALGQIPPMESATEPRFGAECAGVITRVGSGVHDFTVGDAVVAVSPAQGTLGSHLTVAAAHVVPKPETLGFEVAGSVPIVFLTAWYALHELARVRAGERVLVHAATGGTGLAAVQIARAAGAEVFATAGSAAKRELLRTLGVRHVFDSRSLDFADSIRAVTDGAGVDVVLNSIAGDSAERSLACLAPYGRFVELGKRDLLQDRRLGLRPFLRNLTYVAFDLRQLLVDRPEATNTVLRAVMDRFATGELRPLPYRVFHPDQTEAAFRHLAAARHIGKVVLAMNERDVAVARSPRVPSFDGTWLITGGLGGFGSAMAEALAESGVGSLVLLGRKGITDDDQAARVESLRARGVRVRVETADISVRAEVAAVLEGIATDLPPLRGILHCAMVLDDALLADMDADRVGKVLAGKAFGAWHLDELTTDLPLEAFVLFSSATSMVGNRGQGNYAVANAFLDQLAHARRARGQVALAVNWGAIADAGYVARHDDIGRFVAATGMRGFGAAAAYRALTTLWSTPAPQVGVLPMDWSQFLGHHGMTLDSHPRYELLAARAVGTVTTARGSSLREQLETAAAGDRGAVLTGALKTRLAAVLGIPLETLDENMPLMDYLDSLLAVEISAWLERELATKVTIMELMKGPSVLELSELVLARLDA